MQGGSEMTYKITPEMQIHADSCGVCANIHPEDFIYRFMSESPEHYFMDGKQSATKLNELIKSDKDVSPNNPFSLVEFASGYGCVTRDFKNVIPCADVLACDIHPQAMSFISSKLSTKVATSVADPNAFNLSREFDIVFALSFFSHAPKRTFGGWLTALFRHVRPGGSLIFTTHVQVSLQKLWNNSIDLGNEGFWFAPESEQLDLDGAEYGTTISSPAYRSEEHTSELQSLRHLVC